MSEQAGISAAATRGKTARSDAVEGVAQQRKPDPIRLVVVVLRRDGGVYRLAGPFRSLHAAERWGEVNGTYDGFPTDWYVTDLERTDD